MTQQELNALPQDIQNSIEFACQQWGADAGKYVKNVYDKGRLDEKLNTMNIVKGAIDRAFDRKKKR